MKPNLSSRLFAAAAVVMACALPVAAHAAQGGQVEVQGRPEAGSKLRWAPPELVNPIVVELGDGPTYTRLRDDQDYVIKLPKTKKVGSTMIEGGRNVVIIGGYVTVPVAPYGAPQSLSRAISIKNNVGVVHIEGVLIDASGLGMSDGIDIQSPRSTVQIENVRVDGIFGHFSQFHAHVIKPFGGVAALRIDKLTGYSGYQGLTLDAELGPIGSADISRVNLVATGRQVSGQRNNGGHMVWLTSEAACRQTYPIRFGEVYVQPRFGTPLAKAVWPMATADTACPAQASSKDQEVSFPTLPVVGNIQKGMPPQGDFVPDGVAGVGYVSPGYQTGTSSPSDWIGLQASAAQVASLTRCEASPSSCSTFKMAGGSE